MLGSNFLLLEALVLCCCCLRLKTNPAHSDHPYWRCAEYLEHSKILQCGGEVIKSYEGRSGVLNAEDTVLSFGSCFHTDRSWLLRRALSLFRSE